MNLKILFALLFLVISYNTSACTQILPTLNQKFCSSEDILLGEIIAAEQVHNDATTQLKYKVSISVENVFKGSSVETFFCYTFPKTSSCPHIPPVIGDRMIFFIGKNKVGEKYYSPENCTKINYQLPAYIENADAETKEHYRNRLNFWSKNVENQIQRLSLYKNSFDPEEEYLQVVLPELFPNNQYKRNSLDSILSGTHKNELKNKMLYHFKVTVDSIGTVKEVSSLNYSDLHAVKELEEKIKNLPFRKPYSRKGYSATEFTFPFTLYLIEDKILKYHDSMAFYLFKEEKE